MEKELYTDDPLKLRVRNDQYRDSYSEDLPRYFGGLVGYFGYDTVRYVEPRMQDSEPPDPMGTGYSAYGFKRCDCL